MHGETQNLQLNEMDEQANYSLGKDEVQLEILFFLEDLDGDKPASPGFFELLDETITLARERGRVKAREGYEAALANSLRGGAGAAQHGCRCGMRKWCCT